ncbi:fosfomycin resistance glutathione transferase [Halopseudomonas bauzanensis]|uniref:Catechol 2,3-dioxygenase n=1 Tax=Halopseudomonas bauzanensis TaxID=653930 RepID=A0A1I4N0Q0_9GAMM|nr:fosfomycin resistance glutathione transferase [Halopseudomonas bauzanensis]SES09641.1 Catechol 2,3-dioxygenase [Halopseudomonas bauzanensis]SFM09152.1 Catechol 2,3-dioxygenase [Halopseudomonas bauzanensis]
MDINHITFSVADLSASIAFYRDLLGMRLHVFWDTGAYLTAGETWICLSVGVPQPANDYSHVAFSIGEEELYELRTKLRNAGITEWKQNSSEGDSIYFLDPNGHRLELHCGTLVTRLAELEKLPYKGLVWC